MSKKISLIGWGLFCQVITNVRFNDAWNIGAWSYITSHDSSQVSHQKAEGGGLSVDLLALSFCQLNTVVFRFIRKTNNLSYTCVFLSLTFILSCRTMHLQLLHYCFNHGDEKVRQLVRCKIGVLWCNLSCTAYSCGRVTNRYQKIRSITQTTTYVTLHIIAINHLIFSYCK